MDNKINNRLEAFLSWMSTGVKPEGWDLEPRNKEEYYLAAEADRIDQIEQGGGPTPPPPPAEPTDYNELINKPIDPYPTDRPIIPIEGSEITIEAGMTLHGDDTKVDDMIAYLRTLTYTSIGEEAPPMCTITGDIDDETGPDANSIIAIKYPGEILQLDHDVYMIIVATDDSGALKPDSFLFVSEDFNMGGESFVKGYQKDIDFIMTATVPVNQNIDIETFNSMVSLLGAPDVDAGTYYYKAGQPAGDKPIVVGDVLGGNIKNLKISSSNFDLEFLQSLPYAEPGGGINVPNCQMLSMMVMAMKQQPTTEPWGGSEAELWTTIYFDTTVTPAFDSSNNPMYTFYDATNTSKSFELKYNSNNEIFFSSGNSFIYNSETDILVYDGSQFLMDHYILKNFETKGSSTDKNFNHDTLEGLYQVKAESSYRSTNNFVYDMDPTIHSDYRYTGTVQMLLYVYISDASNIGIPIFPGTYNIFDENGMLCGRVSNTQGLVDITTLDKHTFMDEYLDLSEAGFELPVAAVYGDYYTLVPAVPAELSLGNKKVLLANESANHIYKHNINFTYNHNELTTKGTLIIYTNTDTQFTAQTLYDYLKKNDYKVSTDFYAGNNFYGCSACRTGSGYSTVNYFGLTTYRDWASFDILSRSGTSSTIQNGEIPVADMTLTDNVETIL